MPFPKDKPARLTDIDNRKRSLSFKAILFIIILIALFTWFFTGGTFKLYASIFFFLYNLTGQIWISVILIGVVQNIAFLPLRFIGLMMEDRVKQFKDTVESAKEDQQYFVFNKKVKEGDTSALFFILEFIVNAMAFFSAGRIFLIDFYTQKLDPKFLYDFVAYPKYPLKGTLFTPPFIRIDETFALPWSTIFQFWAVTLALAIIPRLLWRLVKFILKNNKKVLNARIGYNRAVNYISGFSGTLFVISLFLLRNIPKKVTPIILSFDLTRQNTTLNLFTAVVTFLTTVHAGIKRNNLAVAEAKKADIEDSVIKKVSRQNLRNSFKNALILGIGAFLITNQIPSAFELSVATFEALYIISPYSFDLILKSAKPKLKTDEPTS